MARKLPLDQIQGNVTPGFRKDNQAFLLFQWTDRDLKAVRAWIGKIHPYIASAEEVAAFNQVFLMIKKRLRRQEEHVLRSTWVNVGFTTRGLKSLLPPAEFEQFPVDFKRAPGERGQEPDEKCARLRFEVGRDRDNLPDAVVIIGADSPEELHTEICRQKELAEGLTLMRTYEGESLKDGREHFGFRDLISQPDPADPLKGWNANGRDKNIVAPGEFILGLEQEAKSSELDNGQNGWPVWAKFGSYLVFRKIEERVDLFEREVQEATDAIKAFYANDGATETTDDLTFLEGITPNLMRALLVGRWPSGHKLAKTAALPVADPGAHYQNLSDMPEALRTITAADFGEDKSGARCPFFAHVRKAHPRTEEEARSRRIIRRGIPYGPALKDPKNRAVHDGVERGVFFLAYQASLARQFEFLQQSWLSDNGPAEPVLSTMEGAGSPTGYDPVAGIRPITAPSDPRLQQVALQLEDGRGFERIPFPTKLGDEQPVRVKASAYFFVPAISALKQLSVDPTSRRKARRA